MPFVEFVFYIFKVLAGTTGKPEACQPLAGGRALATPPANSFMAIGTPEGSCEKIENRLLLARSVRRSARSTQVERALRARFRLWIQNRDGSGLSRFNFFTAPGVPPVVFVEPSSIDAEGAATPSGSSFSPAGQGWTVHAPALDTG